jgi:hypothetical protein
VIRRLLAPLALFALPATAFAAPVASVEVVRKGDQWTADYRLSKRSPVWVFADSIEAREMKGSWRAASWTVLTPGVRLERRGWYDVLVADRGDVPQQVKLSFTPFVKDIEAAYDAALAFSDGSVALYDGKFKVFPAGSPAEVDKFPIDPDRIAGNDDSTRVEMRDSAGSVLFHGRRTAVASLEDEGAYVLFGKAEPVEGEAIRTLIDPGLPKWLAAFLGTSIPAVLDSYARKLGPAPDNKPLVMVSWAGATPGVRSMGGSFLPSTIVMTFEGEGVAAENADLRNGARWFAAHEGAHFWLGQAVHYSSPRESWITEGGADLLAYRAVAAADPGFDVRAQLQSALEQCIDFSRKGGIASANERGDHKAYYYCGTIFGLVAERASGGDFGVFVRGLIDSNLEDHEVTRAEWLAALEARAPGKGLSEAIARLLDQPAPDAKPWTALLVHAGVPVAVGPDGVPKLQ